MWWWRVVEGGQRRERAPSPGCLWGRRQGGRASEESHRARSCEASLAGIVRRGIEAYQGLPSRPCSMVDDAELGSQGESSGGADVVTQSLCNPGAMEGEGMVA